MQRHLFFYAFFFLFLSIPSTESIKCDQKQWYGLYLKGEKLGYGSHLKTKSILEGENVLKDSSEFFFNSTLLGQPLKIQESTVTYSNLKGELLQEEHKVQSGDRTFQFVAKVRRKDILIETICQGKRDQKKVTLPAGASFLVDFIDIEKILKNAKSSSNYYMLMPHTASVEKVKVGVPEEVNITVKGIQKRATMLHFLGQPGPVKTYIDSEGKLLKVDGLHGMELFPEVDERAAKSFKSLEGFDLASLSRVPLRGKKISKPLDTKNLELKISGIDLNNLPKDAHQEVKKIGQHWSIKIHPVKPKLDNPLTIEAVKTQKQEWTRPEIYIPTNASQWSTVTAKLVDEDKNPLKTAINIKRYVHQWMRVNPKIGLLRNAEEIFNTREGVCRDYAVLTVALLRSVGIPARLISGLACLEEMGDFCYHAWVEAWDGAEWVGLDATIKEDLLSASYFKLAQGHVEEAFAFRPLCGANIELIEAN